MKTVNPMRAPLILLLGLFTLSVWAVEDITVLGLFAGKAMLRIDGTQHLLKVGQRSPEGITLIAADSEQATIEVDGKQLQLPLGNHISSQFVAAKVKSVQIWPDTTGMYSVNGAINGKSIGFLIDTGANTIALNAIDAKRLNIDYKAKGQKVMGETASGTTWVYYLTLDTVTVGEIKLYNVEAIVFDGAFPSKALLGLTFLNRVDMKRDGDVLTLEQK
jgi:aspartyl protease family protein